MHAWESIQKTLEHIEEHIGEDIKIEELADIAALSFFYYQRLFARLVKKPVREYIKLRRLACACKALEDKSSRILDVALDYGFCGHETFTRAFREAYGITPSEFRNSPVPLNNFLKPNLLLGYVMIDEGVPLISDGIVLEINRRRLEKPLYFLGFSGHVRADSQIPVGEVTGINQPGELWERFHREKHKLNRKPGGFEVGVAYGDNTLAGHFRYFAGAEVERGVEADGFDLWEMPAREYAVCGFEAETFEELVGDALFKATNYSYSWLEKHGLSYGDFIPELYYKDRLDPAYMELWIPVTEKS